MKFYIVFVGLICHFALNTKDYPIPHDVERAVVMMEPHHVAKLVIPVDAFKNAEEAESFGSPAELNGEPARAYPLKHRNVTFHLPAGLPGMPAAMPHLGQMTIGHTLLPNIITKKPHQRTRSYVDYTGGELRPYVTVEGFHWTPAQPATMGCHPSVTQPSAPGGPVKNPTAVPASFYSADLTNWADEPSVTVAGQTIVLKRDAVVFVKNESKDEQHTGPDFKEYLWLLDDGNCIASMQHDNDHYHVTYAKEPDIYKYVGVTPSGSIHQPECTNTQYP